MTRGKGKWVVFLVLALLAASCSSSPGTQEETPRQSPTKTPSQPAVTPKDGKLVDKDTEITVMLGESNLVPLSQDMKHYQRMYEQTGIKINFMPIPSADYASKKNTLLSTNDLPDIIQVAQSDVNNFADTGIFVDLSKYKDRLPNFYEKAEQIPEAKFTFINGSPFAFPTLNRWDLTRGSSLVVRSDVMEELGIAAPKTFDEFYTMLKKFKEAYPDSVPYVNRNGSKNLMMTLGYSLGSGHTIMFDPQADKFLFQPAKPETKQALTYLNKLYQEKLLDPDYISVTGAQWEEKIAAGKGLSYLDNVGFAQRHLPGLREVDGNAMWDNMLIPTNSFGYSRALYTAPQNINRLWAISSNSKHIDAAIDMFNWLYSEEAADLLNLGIEGEDFIRQADGTIELTPQVIATYNNDKGIFDSKAMHKDRGNAAYETFIPYSDLHSYFVGTDDMLLRWYEIQQNDQAYAFPVPNPPLNAEERETVAEIQPKLETIATEMFDKLITGAETIDAFDKYMERFKAEGVDKLEKIFNDAYQRMK